MDWIAENQQAILVAIPTVIALLWIVARATPGDADNRAIRMAGRFLRKLRVLPPDPPGAAEREND